MMVCHESLCGHRINDNCVGQLSYDTKWDDAARALNTRDGGDIDYGILQHVQVSSALSVVLDTLFSPLEQPGRVRLPWSFLPWKDVSHDTELPTR